MFYHSFPSFIENVELAGFVCSVFDKMTRVGWNFVDMNPLYLSHLLSPNILRKHLMKLCAGSSYIKGFQPQWGKEIHPALYQKLGGDMQETSGPARSSAVNASPGSQF